MRSPLTIVALSLTVGGCWAEWHVDRGSSDYGCEYDDDDAPCEACSECGGGEVLPPPPVCPDARAAGVTYVSHEEAVCESVAFSCVGGGVRFDASCGCGCVEPSAPEVIACDLVDDPRFQYVSTDATICAEVRFACPEGSAPFADECGCGCVEPEPAPACPDESDPNVSYVSRDPAICAQITVSCGAQCVKFDDACGCGCIGR